MSASAEPLRSRFAVLGDPVAHSLSPAMHEAAYRALGLPHSYEALRTSAAELEGRVDALRRGTFAGLNITVPHKKRVLGLVDLVHPTARAIGAANTLVRRSDGLVEAHNTDAPALADELRALAPELGPRFVGETAIVLGSGGAARAAVAALGLELGVRRIVVRARRLAEGAAAARLEEDLRTCVKGVAEVSVTELRPNRAVEAVARVVVQATSAGMAGADAGEVVSDAVDWSALGDRAVALDVVYAPPSTPFLRAAGARGLRRANGLGMLVGQGARAIELWLGLAAPRAAMLAALGA